MAFHRQPSSRQIFEKADFRFPGIIMFGRYQYAASQRGLTLHSHGAAIEICFLERGEQTYRIADRIYRLRGNDQFFTLPGELHDTADLPQEPGILYWLILNLETRGVFLGLAEQPASRLKSELLRMPTRHFRAHPDCARIQGQLVELLAGRDAALSSSYRQLRVQALLLQYLTLTIEASHQGMTGSATPLLQRVLQYMDNHIEEPVHVPRLAEVAGLSESRFKTRFKREIGVPPAEFWLRKKIEKAAALLKKRNVTEVAHELGFSSSQYFATVFKRYTLRNPSQFRRA